jgi:beta-phosphoglucomutase-like phosphatase (HAD superfamily)
LNKLLIFDLDGTLVDCKTLHQRAFRWAINRDYDEELLEGLPTARKIEILQGMGWDLDAQKVADIKQQWTFAHIQNYVQPNPRLKTRIKELGDAGWDISVCSNATQKFVNTCLEILEIKDLINSGIYTATDNWAKPATDMWHTCDQFWGKRGDIWIYEDSPIGILGATQFAKERRWGKTRVIKVDNSGDLLDKLAEI